MQLELTSSAKTMNWIIFNHADACRNPIKVFRELFAVMGIDWTERIEIEINKSNRPSKGNYETSRVAEYEGRKWKKRLSPHIAKQVEIALSELGIDIDK